MRSPDDRARESDAGFTLDPELLKRRRAASAHRLHTQQMPIIRLLGFVILCVIVVFHDVRMGYPLVDAGLLALLATNIAYPLLSWLALRRGYGRTGRLDLSLLFLHVDVLVWLATLYHLERTHLFFAYLLLVRVADQVGFGFRRAFYFNHVVVASYVGYSLTLAALAPGDARLFDRLPMAVVMYLLGVYLSSTGTVTERLRRRSSQAMRAARELVDRLEGKTQALQGQAEELDAARREAEQASLAKSQFLAMISHEIRTPMNGILGTTELLLGTPLTELQRQYARTAHRSATALLTLIDDVLDLSRIEAGTLTLHPESVDVRALVRDTIELMSATARDKPVHLHCTLPPELPERIECDPLRLRQLLVNLLHNAVRLTERGDVELEVQVHDRAPDGAVRLRFEVRDTGVGITEQQLDSVFDPFTPADAAPGRRTRRVSSLGLAVVRELAGLMGGRVDARSRSGEGSVFGFEAVFRPGSAAPAAPASLDADLPVDAQVLLAEDDPVNQMVVEAMLAQLGCRVTVVPDGDAACAAMAEARYDLVFMDCHMPVMDGYEATRRIRDAESAQGRRTPIVALTAEALASERERCVSAGMDDFMTKPVSSGMLAAALRRWAARRAPAQRTG